MAIGVKIHRHAGYEFSPPFDFKESVTMEPTPEQKKLIALAGEVGRAFARHKCAILDDPEIGPVAIRLALGNGMPWARAAAQPPNPALWGLE